MTKLRFSTSSLASSDAFELPRVPLSTAAYLSGNQHLARAQNWNANNFGLHSFDALQSWMMILVVWTTFRSTRHRHYFTVGSPATAIRIRGGSSEQVPLKNPLWPSGVTSADVNDLIAVCLEDPELNIKGIPDAVERQLYKSTIRLTLNAIYQGLGGLHGTSLFGTHAIQVQRENDYELYGVSPADTKPKRLRKNHPARILNRANLRKTMEELEFERETEQEILGIVADQMLANEDINQRWLPDKIERMLYVNCLKIIFRILTIASASLKVTVCGHDIKLQVEPSARYSILKLAALRHTEVDIDSLEDIEGAPSLPQPPRRRLGPNVDLKSLQALAQTHVDNSVDEGDIILTDGTTLSEDSKPWYLRLFNFQLPRAAQKDLADRTSSSLFSLVIAIVDDLFSQTEIGILSDSICFDLVPSAEGAEGEDTQVLAITGSTEENLQQLAPRKNALPAFLPAIVLVGVGVVVGLTLQRVVQLPEDFPILEPEAWSNFQEQVTDFGKQLWSKITRNKKNDDGTTGQGKEEKGDSTGSKTDRKGKELKSKKRDWMADL